jgi:hypothetical protein
MMSTINSIGLRFRVLLLLILLAGSQLQAYGKSYYIDPVTGSDNNSGNPDAPWKSFKNVISYYQASYRPQGWVELGPGDCIYLKNGIYSETFHPGAWKKGPTGGGSFIAYFRGQKGERDNPIRLRAFPGHKPIIDPNGKGIGVSVFQSSHWEIEGIEVRNAYGRGTSLNESRDVTLHDAHIHDTDGVDNNNIAGLYIVDCCNVEIHDCTFNDNYDRICADTNGKATGNSTNVVIFGGMQGGNISIHDCLIYQSLPISHRLSGGGIKYKHASRVPGAYFRVFDNIFRNCKFFAFATGTANTHFHHNVIIGGGGIVSKDLGGVTHQVNQIFERNTLYDTSAFMFNPTIRWRNKDFPDDPRNIVFRNNIIYDTISSYSRERGIVTIGTYMSDEIYDIVVTQMKFDENYYYNPNGAVRFNIAAGFNYKDGYRKGDMYSLPEWQNTFKYDAGSLEADPLFVRPTNGDFRLRAESPVKQAGHRKRYQ